MKKVILALSVLAIVSCKEAHNKHSESQTEATENHDEHAEHEEQPIQESGLYGNDWVNDINLDNGAKWLANTETNAGILKMKQSISTQATLNLDDYHQLAILLNEDKNFVVKNCTMKGASHDNLHIWLMPLIKKIEALSNAKAIEDASKLKQSIIENVDAYTTYFK